MLIIPPNVTGGQEPIRMREIAAGQLQRRAGSVGLECRGVSGNPLARAGRAWRDIVTGLRQAGVVQW